jgi:hypothetical protein
MAATIKFYAGDAISYELAGSGIGFFGANGFGSSVAVNSYQNNTYITDADGVYQGPKANNIIYTNPSSGIVNTNATSTNLRSIYNGYATLNVRFENDTPVQTQNAKLRIYDRTSITNPASGVTTKVAELIKTVDDSNNDGSGSATWATFPGTGFINLAASPGTSGLSPSGSGTVDDRHDWYLALSASPDSIGSKKQYALWIELEYL